MSIQRLLRHLRNSFLNLGRTLSQWLSRFLKRGLGGLFRVGRQRQAGFVLPTVTMVMLVVSLLTLAMLLRSTDRAKNAQNFRVNEASLNAAAPALERAKAKIEQMFQDPTLPRSTPTDQALVRVFEKNSEKYIFGDETPLKLIFNIDGDNRTGEEDTTLPNNQTNEKPWDETLTTAWKFPVDTNNNGKFDTFTLYGLYFRNPSTDSSGFNRQRNPLEARTPPMAGALGDQCASNVQTSASLVGNSGWFSINGVLKKSFYVYVVNVPITELPTGVSTDDYETFPGAIGGFTALEYQQDRSRIPLSNNAVVYEDDIEMLQGAGLTLNGRVFTNSNFLVGRRNDPIQLFLVSSPSSCYYQAESSKIVVGGNIGNGLINSDQDENPAVVDLFAGPGENPTEDEFKAMRRSASPNGGSDIAYNAAAYEWRIGWLIDAAEARSALSTDGDAPNIELSYNPSNQADPEEVQERILSILNDDSTLDSGTIRDQELRRYFKARTRRVPFGEVDKFDQESAIEKSGGGTYYTLNDVLQTDPLRPPDEWMFPVDPDNNSTSYTKFDLRLNETDCENVACLQETDPSLAGDIEYRIGDRIKVGNNLPAIIYDSDTSEWLEGDSAQQDLQVNATTKQEWLKPGGGASGNVRQRQSQVQDLADVGDTGRDGFWERDAVSKAPESELDNSGGLRIVTGAGIYLPGVVAQAADNDPPPATPPMEAITTIWPDYLPVPKGHDDVFYHPAPSATDTVPYAFDPSTEPKPVNDENSTIPYLRMRATVAYHIKEDDKNNPKTVYDPQATPVQYPRPIACISSYYDPTDSVSAKNKTTENPGAYPAVPGTETESKSNNGIVYPWKTQWDSSLSSNFSLGTLNTQFNVEGTSELIDIANREVQDILNYQAKLQYPNGRWVNETLHNAMDKLGKGNKKLTLSERSSLDAAFCALEILADADGNRANNTLVIKHGHIFETAFLDGRQIKAIEDPTNSDRTNYDLSIEERQPLEIRATVLNLGAMRDDENKISSTDPQDPQDYLIPNTGIIYATREDALMDLSAEEATESNPGNSSTDYILDPTRRPNGIMLVNGERLDRENTHRDAEKGFILATNLPTYILGDFNKHQSAGGTTEQFEFTGQAADLTNRNNFYNRTDLNPNFACRPGGPVTGCTDGDTWRAATILSDSITLLSNDFKVGYRSDGDYDLRNNLAYVGDLNYVASPSPVLNLNNNFVNSNADPSPDPDPDIDDPVDESVLGFDLDGDVPGDSGYLTEDIEEKDATQVPASVYQRRMNGFFDNNFVTSRYFTDGDYTGTGTPTPANDAKGNAYNPFSSYFNNFVTPIQRRGNVKEYLMEICRKIPVSECTADDWVVAYDLNGDGDIDDEVTEYEVDTNGDGTPGPFTHDIDGDGNNDYVDLNGDDFLTISVPEDQNPPPIDTNGNGSPGPFTHGVAPDPNNYIDFNKDGSLTAALSESDIDTDRDGSPGPFTHKSDPSLIDNDYVDLNGDGTPSPELRYNESSLKASYLEKIAANISSPSRLYTGTTAREIPDTNQEDRRYARRVAFLRDTADASQYNHLIKTDGTLVVPDDRPVPLGIKGGNIVADTDGDGSDDADTRANALVFSRVHTRQVEGIAQPIPKPILQLQITSGNDYATDKVKGRLVKDTNWLISPAPTTFNLVSASGDTPARPIESNGGLGNYFRFLENWNGTDSNIGGSVIQLKHSVYGTGPFRALIENSDGGIGRTDGGIFDYQQGYNSDNGKYSNDDGADIASYTPPTRSWGFDVALLTQQPDLFSQRFTVPPTGDPNEYLRQVSRDDRWVETLLCAAQPATRDTSGTAWPAGPGYEDATDAQYNDPNNSDKPYEGIDFNFAVSSDQRPSVCPSS